MYNLIKMQFYRCRHSRLAVLCLLLSAAAGTAAGILVSADSFVTPDFPERSIGILDDVYIIPLFIIQCAFTSLMTGADMRNGAVRNKVVSGKSRSEIYLADTALGIISAFVYTIMFLVPFAICAWNSFLCYIQPSALIACAVAMVLIGCSWNAIFIMISRLITFREVGVLVNMVLIVAIMFSAYVMEGKLSAPEYISTESIDESVQMTPEEVKQVHDGTFDGSWYSETTEDGNVKFYKYSVTVRNEPNEIAPGRVEKAVITQLYNSIPYGQVNAYVNYLTSYVMGDVPDLQYGNIRLFPLYSVVFSVLVTGAGLFFFRRKELK